MPIEYVIPQEEFESFLDDKYSCFTEDLSILGTVAKFLREKAVEREGKKKIRIKNESVNITYARWKEEKKY